MMLFSNATRRPRRAGLAAAGAASLILGGACTSQSEPEHEYPEPPPQAGADAPAGDEHAEPADPAPEGATPGQPDDQGPPDHAQPGGQATGPAPGAGQPAPAGGDVSDEEVSAFVSAYGTIMELQVGYQAEFQQADSAEEVQELEARAQQEVTAAIEDEGLTMERFDEIAHQVETDPDLQERVQDELGPPPSPGAAP